MVCMQTAVNKQFNLGYAELQDENFYRLDNDRDTIMQEPIDMISGWLCKILIARGDFATAILESLRDRGEMSHLVPTLSPLDRRNYFDWRKFVYLKGTVEILIYDINREQRTIFLSFRRLSSKAFMFN